MKFDKKLLQRIAPEGACLGKKVKGAKTSKQRQSMIDGRNAERRATRKRIDRMLDNLIEEQQDANRVSDESELNSEADN